MEEAFGNRKKVEECRMWQVAGLNSRAPIPAPIPPFTGPSPQRASTEYTHQKNPNFVRHDDHTAKTQTAVLPGPQTQIQTMPRSHTSAAFVAMTAQWGWGSGRKVRPGGVRAQHDG